MKWLHGVVRDNLPWENVFAWLLLAMAAVASFFGALTALKWSGLLSAEVASWVQALGSIGAILGAFQIANRQARVAEQMRRKQGDEDLLERYNLTTAIAVDAAAAVRDSSIALREHRGGNDFKADVDRLQESQFMIRSILPSRCPPDVAVSLIRMQRIVIYSLRALEQRQGSKEAFTDRTRLTAEKRERDAKEIMYALAKIRNEARGRVQS